MTTTPTGWLVLTLDEFYLPDDASAHHCRRALQAAGWTARDDELAEAVRTRRTRGAGSTHP